MWLKYTYHGLCIYIFNSSDWHVVNDCLLSSRPVKGGNSSPFSTCPSTRVVSYRQSSHLFWEVSVNKEGLDKPPSNQTWAYHKKHCLCLRRKWKFTLNHHCNMSLINMLMVWCFCVFRRWCAVFWSRLLCSCFWSAGCFNGRCPGWVSESTHMWTFVSYYWPRQTVCRDEAFGAGRINQWSCRCWLVYTLT